MSLSQFWQRGGRCALPVAKWEIINIVCGHEYSMRLAAILRSTVIEQAQVLLTLTFNINVRGGPELVR